MRLTVFIALVAGVSASTPSGFQPSNSDDLTVAFGIGSGLTDATSGVDVPQADTAKPPNVYTSSQVSGLYVLMMVDPDASPPYLHWLQALTPEAHSTTVNKKSVYALTVNSSGPAAIAPYAQPNPPNKAPYTHRYVLLLLNTTDIAGIGDESLSADAQTRSGFNVQQTIKDAGVPIVGSSWFNVTNAAALAAGSVTVSSAAPSPTAGSSSTSAAGGSSSTTSSAAATSSTAKTNVAAALRGDVAIGGVFGAMALAMGLL